MTFDAAFDRTVDVEGGLSLDPNDPGNYTPAGELKGTKYGISAHSYPDVDIANLTISQAKAIYQRDFWAKANCDNLPVSAAAQVFDIAVNSGVEEAIKVLQIAAAVSADGIFGPETMAAIDAMPIAPLLMHLMAARIRYWADLALWENEGRGWARRGATMLDYAATDIS